MVTCSSFFTGFVTDLFLEIFRICPDFVRPAGRTDGYLSRALVDMTTLRAAVLIPDKFIDGKI
jgi:hypothetical protein